MAVILVLVIAMSALSGDFLTTDNLLNVGVQAAVTAILAFSMQETLGNVLGGIVLQLDSSMREGDWVRVEDVSGRVAEITWRHTAIETRNGETVVIPGW